MIQFPNNDAFFTCGMDFAKGPGETVFCRVNPDGTVDFDFIHVPPRKINMEFMRKTEKIVIDKRAVPNLVNEFSGKYAYTTHGSAKGFDHIEYLFASEVENPWAFYGEDARDYALEGMIDGYIPRCKIARMMLSLPRGLPIELKGIAV